MIKLSDGFKENRHRMKSFGVEVSSLVIAIERGNDHYMPGFARMLAMSGAHLAGTLPLDKSAHTLKNWVSVLRKDFKEGLESAPPSPVRAAAYEQFCMGFKLPQDALMDVLSRADERRDERATGVVPIRLSPLMDALVDLHDGYPACNLMLLALATGRRSSEIRKKNFSRMVAASAIDQGHLADVPAKHRMFFTGQLKMRDAVRAPYPIPSLLTSGIVEQMLDLGTAHPGVAEINRLGDALIQSGVWPDCSDAPAPNIRSMRGVYAMGSLAMWKPDNMQPWAWVAAVLGHDDDDMTTAQTYMRWEVSI